MKTIIISYLLFVSIAVSLPCWQQDDFEKAQLIPKTKPVMQYDTDVSRGNWQTWSYIHELCQTVAFIGSLQVADSLSPDFGGIIEGEDEPDIVQTDNRKIVGQPGDLGIQLSRRQGYGRQIITRWLTAMLMRKGIRKNFMIRDNNNRRLAVFEPAGQYPV